MSQILQTFKPLLNFGAKQFIVFSITQRIVKALGSTHMAKDIICFIIQYSSDILKKSNERKKKEKHNVNKLISNKIVHSHVSHFSFEY